MKVKGIISLVLALIVLLVAELCWGSITIPLDAVIDVLLGNETKESWKQIVLQIRIPRMFTACLVGGGLALSGLFMQTLFRNALAGPYVLGISSGASLGVACILFLSNVMVFGNALRQVGIVAGALIGAMGMLIVILVVARRTRNSVSLLLVGLMAGIFVNGIISILQFLAESNVLQSYVIWSMGSLTIPSGNAMWLLTFSIVMLLVIGASSTKSLNAMLMGEDFAKGTGVDVNRVRIALIAVTAIAVAIVTAYCGPVAFIGIAAPQLAKRWFKSANHKVILFPVCLTGCVMLLLCDWISQLPGLQYTIPINAVTSLLGAPVVIWTVLRSKRDFEF